MAIKAVETIRRIRDEHYGQVKDLTPEERREFYDQKAREASKRMSRRRKRKDE